MCQFSSNNFNFFDPNFPKKEFLGPDFKKLSPDLESAHASFLVCQFSVKIDNFEFFDLNLRKLPDTCNIKVQITLRLFQRAGWKLK